MGGCISRRSKKKEKKINDNYSKMADTDFNKDKNGKREIKLLLLGPGQSGKSTIFKQIRILHKNGIPERELQESKQYVHNNIISSIKILITQALMFQYDLSAFRTDLDSIDTLEESTLIPFSMTETLDRVWRSSVIQQTFSRSSEFQLNDSADYFLNDLTRVLDPNYSPTSADFLRVRVRTNGIWETSWQLNGVTFRMVDVGGQRSERRKWIHCFDSVTAVIFVAAISEYDQVLAEDSTRNRLEEAIILFNQICQNKYFEETSIILFLNKVDLFAEKLKKVDLQCCFPNYEGKQTYNDAIKFIENEFVKGFRKQKRQVYIQQTCATNTSNIKFVFDAVKDIILNQSLSASGMA
eukprot:c12355_g1_i1.p1 GENE.c12355_g1_i1~~c12355_g1_i1.p1  ORF type:complete len:353 (+),score=114.37 c12355_g1_i1:98-1156(+)